MQRINSSCTAQGCDAHKTFSGANLHVCLRMASSKQTVRSPVSLQRKDTKVKLANSNNDANNPHVWPSGAPVEDVSQLVLCCLELWRVTWEIQDHYVLVRAATLVVHILKALSLPEEEVRVRQREKTPGGFSLSALREMVGGDCERAERSSTCTPPPPPLPPRQESLPSFRHEGK